ncbi:hypothetical protein Y694_04242 [Methylibium sp. T29-B]|nr:hypothetical protein Y694_04242 [Methylibium sp. T29-B]
MLALQFAARRRDVATGAQLTPHVAREALVELGERQGVGGAAGLALAVEQARGHRVAHQLVQHIALQFEHRADQRVIGGDLRLAAEDRVGALCEIGRQPALQGRREADAVGRQQAARQRVERQALLRGRQRLQRVSPAARRITQRPHAADLARQHGRGTAQIAQRIADRAPQHRVVAARRQRAPLLARQQVARDREALAGEGHRIVAEVELQRLGVDAQRVVLVGAVGQLGFGAAGGDARQFGRLVGRGERLVAVLDGPVVVGTERGLERHAAGLAGRRQVDGGVLHHRAGQRMVGGEGRVGQLRLAVDPGGTEVVAQPQRVADLVHRHVLQVGQHVGLGVEAAGIEFAARLEHVERVAELLGGAIGVSAGSGVMPRMRVRALTDREHLGALGAAVARGQALDADVGIDDFAAARIDVARADGAEGRCRVGHPAHRGAVHVQRVEVGIVGLHLDANRITETDALEGLVPLQDAGADGAAVLVRDAAVQPVGDGLDRLGQRRRRVLLLQTPAVDEALARRAREVVAEIAAHALEVADAGIGGTRRHRLLGQPGQRVVDGDEQAACVGHGAGRARHHRRARLGLGDAGGGVMPQHLEAHRVGQRALLADRGVARLEGVALAVAAVQRRGNAQQIADEQRIELDQHRLALRVRLAGHRRAGDEARRERRLHRTAGRRARGGGVREVRRDQLHLIVEPAELDDARAAGHQAAEQPGLADAGGQLGRKEVRPVQILGLQLEPELVLLAPQREQAFAGLGVLHHCREGRRRTGCRCRRRSGPRGGRWRRRRTGLCRQPQRCAAGQQQCTRQQQHRNAQELHARRDCGAAPRPLRARGLRLRRSAP